MFSIYSIISLPYSTWSGQEGPWSNSQPIDWGKWHSLVSILELQLTNLSFMILSPFEWQALRVTQLKYEKIKKELQDAHSINASGGTVSHNKKLAMKCGQVTGICNDDEDKNAGSESQSEADNEEKTAFTAALKALNAKIVKLGRLYFILHEPWLDSSLFQLPHPLKHVDNCIWYSSLENEQNGWLCDLYNLVPTHLHCLMYAGTHDNFRNSCMYISHVTPRFWNYD